MNFYFEAAKVLDRLNTKQGSIKGLIATLPEKSRKRSAALIIETLKYKPVLLEVINAAKLMKEERKLNSQSLTLVLAGDGPIKQAIVRHKTRLHGEFQKLKIKRGVTSNSQLAQNGDEESSIPRYVRVNTALWTTDEAVDHFTSRGFSLSASLGSSKEFMIDAHIPDLLAFVPQTSLADDPAYRDGRVILQDKASCFPAFILSPPPMDGTVVIDATSAPGNKTSHLSALMKGQRQKEDEVTDEDRLAKLAKFQLKMIQHAMKFPNVQRLVYSTCSIHAAENEHVVRAALESDEAKAGPFSLAPRNEVIPLWRRRGLPEEMNSNQGEACRSCCDSGLTFRLPCFVQSKPTP
ncbi:williams-Beuren syndrome critical region protein 20 copy A [Coprinopsis sp. MPI-PUGE-AT-0042]|nr:williams-Beuren syndrome critical region protein 20 copy A [Coprinopsis sp. MPI-PUGE-AT-0042]